MSTPVKSLYNYMVIFEKEADGGYHAGCPALKGWHSQGDSFEEASANIREAIELYIESLKADKESIPESYYSTSQCFCMSNLPSVKAKYLFLGWSFNCIGRKAAMQFIKMIQVGE